MEVLCHFCSQNRATCLAGAWGDGLYRLDKNYNTMPLNIQALP